METHYAKDFRHLARLLKQKDAELKRKMARAARRAAQKHAAYLRRNMPVASSELRNSVQVQGTQVVVDAPHAAAVERGSRPHWPPLEPILEWVKLRGFQGLVSKKQLARLPGTTTAAHATSISLAIHQHMGMTALSVDAPLKVAKAIQATIAKYGTKPQWYMRNSLPAAHAFLGAAVLDELKK